MLRRLVLSMLLLYGTYLLLRELAAPPRDFTYISFVQLYCGICFVLVLCVRFLIRFIELRFLLSIRRVRIAFVGWSFRLGKVLQALDHEVMHLRTIEGYFVDPAHPDLRPPERAGYQEIGSLDHLESLLKVHHISELIVDQSKVAPNQLQQLALTCGDAMVVLRMIPWSTEIWPDQLSLRILGGVPLIGVKNLRQNLSLNRVLKRGIDIVGSIVGLLFSAPVIAVLAILIRRESPGPVFYHQTRIGLNGEPFEIFKLRSMRLDANAEKGVVRAVENDPRRLKIGKFMRAWNLDELPQFWNVLKGEMSLVGPRPEILELVGELRDNLKFYNLRHSCKPGVTGWAAVHGLRGNTSLEDRLDYDLYYIEHWSLLLDFKIMFRTLVPPKNAY